MIHIVSRGDTVYAVSQKYDIPMEQIIYDNQLEGLKHLVSGQALYIDVLAADAPHRPGKISSYVYPFIQVPILQDALAAIDEILIFSYGFTAEGSLVYPPTDDLWLIEQSWNQGVQPMLVLTPLGPDGRFNNYLIHQLLQNESSQDTLIQNVLSAVENRGFAGTDVDFEYILPQDRAAYAAFVGKLRNVMNANGYTVSVALAPKTSPWQPGILYEGMDYKLLGENADFVFLMTYEWGYTYGPPMAVAPLDQVRRVVEYAVSEILPEKIIMGIPNYGYDWTLPFEKGKGAARLIGNVEAVEIAADFGADIQFDSRARSPYFTYWNDLVQHEVWFEDVRSIQEKVVLAEQFGLAGVGYWNLMRPFRANWMYLQSLTR